MSHRYQPWCFLITLVRKRERILQLWLRMIICEQIWITESQPNFSPQKYSALISRQLSVFGPSQVSFREQERLGGGAWSSLGYSVFCSQCLQVLGAAFLPWALSSKTQPQRWGSRPEKLGPLAVFLDFCTSVFHLYQVPEGERGKGLKRNHRCHLMNWCRHIFNSPFNCRVIV